MNNRSKVMPSPFAITTATNAVSLDAQKRSEASFTVSNTSGGPIRGRAQLATEAPASADWLTLTEESEQDFSPDSTQQYTVKIAVPTDTPAGTYSFRLNMVGVENPDELFTQGPSVTFQVPEPELKKPFPWWIVIVAGVLTLCCALGIGGYFVATNLPGPTSTPSVTPSITPSPTPTHTPTPSSTPEPTKPPNRITFTFKGHITSFEDHSGVFDDSISTGTHISGRYTIDKNVTDSNTLPTVGDYRHTEAGDGIQVEIGNYTFESHPQNPDFLLEISNDHGGKDNYLLRSYQNRVLQNETDTVIIVTGDLHISWQLDDSTGAALPSGSGDAMVLTAPNLSDWTQSFGLTIQGGESFFIRGVIDDVAIEP
jgi:hypothetical protein